MPIATTDEQRALCSALRGWAGRAGTAAVRAREPGTPASGRPEAGAHPLVDPVRWAELAAMGVFAVAVPEGLGGAGGRVVDAVAAIEQLADALVPGPILTTVLAGLVLAGEPDSRAAKEILPRIADGTAPCAAATGPGGLVGTLDPDGRLTVRGEVGPVPGAGESTHLLLAARVDGRDVWFVADAAGMHRTDRTPLDFSGTLADLRTDGLLVPPDRVLLRTDTRRVADLAVTLVAAEAAGVAAWCLRTATDYAGVREQFGRSIGSFQAIKHLCADMLCRVEQAAALAWDAARAAEDDPAQLAVAAASAGAFALDAAVDNAKDCVQVLGGIGFTWEHDAHLYLRRALVLRQLGGGGAAWRRRAATLALDGARRRIAIDASSEVDRERVRAVVAEIAALPTEARRARLADTGYLAPHWPAPHGLDAAPGLQLLIDAELASAGVARPDLVIGAWAAPTILRHGTPEQCARFVGPTLRGELTWCQLFSEPEAGSDLASLRTRAEPVDGGWRLRGQKVWTSLAASADWAICLARTDQDAPKHRGITYFLVDMRSAGIDVRPLREITGDAVFNEVWLDGVFVPDECVVGPVHGGWRLARTTLANERVALSGGSSLGDGVEALLAIVGTGQSRVEAKGTNGSAPVDHDRLGALVAQAVATGLLDVRTTLRALDGREPGPESSVRKLVGVANRQAVAEAALELFGADGATVDGPVAPVAHEFLLTRCLSIAGGTTQVLRTLAAERILGLPRDPAG